MSDAPIGIFDSGIGGLTVVHEILAALPAERLIYLGDTARTPYGTKSAEIITRYSLENTDFMLEKGVKILVVACNAMSAVALDGIRSRAGKVAVVGVIEPGAKAAAAATASGRIGVIGTEATIASGAYTAALRRIRPGLEIYTRACPLFVPLAEEGWTENDVARAAAAVYLESLRASGIDTLILGCTHYPLLKPTIGAFLGAGVRLVDSAKETAREVAARLSRDGLRRPEGKGSASFFVTDVPDRFVRVGRRFLGERVESAVRIER
ncbi:MAG: glutamate racemase [Candidatus Binatia bacterium]